MRPRIVWLFLLFGCGGNNYTDLAGKCDVDSQKQYLLGWSQDLYLWYSELPSVNLASYATPLDLFDVLRTTATTASGHPKDKFHFTYPTTFYEQLSQSGTTAGYGITWAEFAQSPPRNFVVAFVEPGSPAEQNGIGRGAKLLSVDGVDAIAGDPDPLNAGLFFANAGEQHTIGVLDPGASAERDVTMTAQVISVPAVRDVAVVAGSVGYMNFNDHDAEAEKLLFDTVTSFKSQGITDLVLDMRYNGGGIIDIAAEAAYMLSSPLANNGRVFERLQFNDKHPELAQSEPFLDTAAGWALTPGTPLPHLDLPRVFVLAEGQTCSASEAIINGLRGIDVQVVIIGSQTCGKPYAFQPLDNCGTTYFSINIQGVNAKGFGDYADGFAPDCQVADDFTHALGDPQEAMLAAALQYRADGTCPPASSNPGVLRGFDRRSVGNLLRTVIR
ncbi:MAG TPA: S41 family peptidase [Myxococcales bacterium]|nr:S41 family peptidase [Myxococcales bacterium]